MVVIGIFGIVGIMGLAIGLASLTAYSGWVAVRDELVRRNFRSQPPGAMNLALTVLGVILPFSLIVLFLASLAGTLLLLLLRMPAG